MAAWKASKVKEVSKIREVRDLREVGKVREVAIYLLPPRHPSNLYTCNKSESNPLVETDWKN